MKKKRFFSRKTFFALIPAPLMAPVHRRAAPGAAFNVCSFVFRAGRN